MKVKNLKYIFIVFLWLSFFSYSLGSESVPLTECSNVAGYSNNPTWYIQSQSATNNDNWFYNNENALKWWYQYHTNMVSVEWNVTNIISKRIPLFQKYDPLSLNSYNAAGVWHFQNASTLAGCSVNTDCKLWKDTAEQFFTCNICTEFGYEEPKSIDGWWNVTCENDTLEMVWEWDWAGYCCKKKTCESRWLSGQVEWWSCADWYKPAEDPNDDCCVKKTCEEKWFSGDAVWWSCGTWYLPSSDPECCNKAVCTDPNKSVNSTNECDNWYSYNSESACCERQSCSTINEVYVDKSDWWCWDWLTDTDVDFCCQPGSCIDPAIPANGGSCMSWYNPSTQWTLSCCTLVCPGETQYLSGWAWSCQPCETWTIPNISHTKCVCDPAIKCCGIQLNMAIPFIWDCIENESDGAWWTGTTVVNSITAFPILMQWMMKIIMSFILIISFLLIIVSGLMLTMWGFKSTNWDKWKTMIKNVIVSLILLWLSWLILKLINPSFFGG